MAYVRGYMGISLDGFIAGPGESLDWLYEHGSHGTGDFTYEAFEAKLGTTVMGRTTWDWVQREIGNKSPYPHLDSIVVTSRPIENLPPRVSAWNQGIDALVEHLRALPGKDVWIVGGGQLQSAVIDRYGMDYLELYVVPYLVGSGTRLWPGSEVPQLLELDDVRHVERGVVRMAYKLAR